MSRRIVLTYVALLVAAAGVGAVALLVGQGSLSDPQIQSRLLELRGTRMAAAALAGAALAVGGVVVQGLFRNPLVSPSLLGTTGGAMLGGQAAILAFGAVPALHTLPWVGPHMVLPFGCLLGAQGALLLLLLFVKRRSDNLSLLLTGFILSSLFLSIGGFVTSVAQDSWDVARAVVAFTLGGVGGVSRRQILLAAPLVLVGAGAAWTWASRLDLLLSGEEEAAALGVDVRQTRRWLTVWVAVLSGAAVSIGGNVIFVGLNVPHALRPFVGVHHRRLIPAAALGGAVFVVACDIVARVAPTTSEIPLGVVTGIIGAPLFLSLLARSRQEMVHG
jgi:iron complex transport system permease protein